MREEGLAADKLEAMMREHGDAIVRLCCMQLDGDVSLAQDAAQETFLKAWRHYGTFRGKSSEKTWLCRIAVNVCRDMRRTAWFRLVDRRRAVEELGVSSPDADMPFGDVSRAVAGLDVKYRVPITLRYVSRLDVEEISKVLHLPPSTVRTRLRRGKEQLKVILQEGGVTL